MKLRRSLAVALLLAAPLSAPSTAAWSADEPSIVVAGSQPVSQAELDRGRYLVRVGGCNDCHTAGYVADYGGTPEQDWLLGDDTAFVGRWGTAFASNLRLTLLRYNDDQWLARARSLEDSAVMPAERLRTMSDADLLAVLRYVQWLGPRGEPAPPALPPGEAWVGASVRYERTTP
jgi:mono/diheme cytochrome c family protein